jgi:hypothetical protein
LNAHFLLIYGLKIRVTTWIRYLWKHIKNLRKILWVKIYTNMDVICDRIQRAKPYPVVEGYFNANVCSNGKFRVLSPMLIGPVEWMGYRATNIENLWQFSKVYEDELYNNEIKASYYARRDAGFENPKGIRRPKKGKVAFCYIGGERLNYEQSRNKVYIPMYCKYVEGNLGLQALKEVLQKTNVQILGFDGRKFDDLQVELRNLMKPFGHELIVCGLLKNNLVWKSH